MFRWSNAGDGGVRGTGMAVRSVTGEGRVAASLLRTAAGEEDAHGLPVGHEVLRHGADHQPATLIPR
jgi:hypothetical protein